MTISLPCAVPARAVWALREPILAPGPSCWGRLGPGPGGPLDGGATSRGGSAGGSGRGGGGRGRGAGGRGRAGSLGPPVHRDYSDQVKVQMRCSRAACQYLPVSASYCQYLLSAVCTCFRSCRSSHSTSPTNTGALGDWPIVLLVRSTI